MKVRYLNSFILQFESMPAQDRRKVTGAVSGLLGFIEKRVRPPAGLGIKKLRKNLWEARAGIRTRVLFALEPGLVTFAFTGNHDEIRRYLRK
ncbi:hypothetical protein COY52_10495 [Candidatus Desantisbacteria bacterium CG_4_10_14_0_8_um_filter_48_22]|uniref:Cytotoxin n=1 Tax=Candidatus Desantisbacteria bacterium CG_4_10_14_0_8_um_filter_48_22 TaxID=1974543 RepID=A0A2M7S6G6_9BACT|nr:MAG: hypothetical protein AUJ67_01875 [Candidatus Desantisbacteria bacterium CG1_02_49_89]PIZ15086.1 MAG: hypothetical protein COY52_10495 [Candidatus Desantisbacteria bacterium CG_4_10_14_0_8_um_filter_48_22]